MNPLGNVALIVVLAAPPALSQAKSRNQLYEEAVIRRDVLEKQFSKCDKLRGEGFTLTCYIQCLVAYEIEIDRLTSEVLSTLPEDQKLTFNRSVHTWRVYFQAEKKHLKNLNNHLGSVSWIGLNADLVAVAKSRCDFLIGQIL